MRLTKTIRDAFVRAVMNDVPKVDYHEQVRTLILEDSIKQLPEKLQPIARDKGLNCYLRTQTYYPGKTFGGYSAYAASSSYKPSASIGGKLTELMTLDEAQRQAREKLEDRLHGVADGCTTRKALAEALPEFARYLPPEKPTPSRSLPVLTNVVTEFVKAGWPKGKTPPLPPLAIAKKPAKTKRGAQC